MIVCGLYVGAKVEYMMNENILIQRMMATKRIKRGFEE